MFIGIDLDEARSFAQDLRAIAHRAGEVGADLGVAELLSDVVTGVQGELASIPDTAERLASTVLDAANQVGEFRVNLDNGERHPLTNAHVGWGPLEPYLSRGWRDWSIGHSNRETWLDRTRLDPDAMRRYRAWGVRYGVDEHAVLLMLSEYISRNDRQVTTNQGLTETNAYMLSAVKLTSPEIMIDTEARRQFLDLELEAVEHDWTEAQHRAAQQEALDFLLNEPVAPLYPDSPINSHQLGVAFALLLAQNSSGADLPVLSDDELGLVLASGTDAEGFSRLGNDIVAVTAATSNLSSSDLAVGLRGLGSLVDGAALLNALAEGDTEFVREKTSDLAAGALIMSAARWLLPRMVSGPVVTIAALVVALTQIGPPGEIRPTNPPRNGWTNEFGVIVGDRTCQTRTGDIDTIACAR